MSFLVLKAYLKLVYFDLYLARGNFAALYEKVRCYPLGKKTAQLRCHRKDLLGSGHGLHLVLERSALPAAIGSNCVSTEKLRRPCADGHWRAANAVQGARLG